MTLSEKDLRVLEELERELSPLDSPRRRRLRDRSVLLASAGVTIGLTLLALGLWAASPLGTAIGVVGSVLFLWASHTGLTSIMKSVLADPARWRLAQPAGRR